MRKALLGVAASGCAVAAVVFGVTTAGSARRSDPPIIAAAKGELRAPRLATGKVVRPLPFISSGTISAASDALRLGADDERLDEADGGLIVSNQAIGAADLGPTTPGTLGCARRDRGKGVRVNDDCSFRRQAEEDIAAGPANPRDLLAGQNDSRMGFNQCWIDYSTDNGVHWGEVAPPFRQHLNSPELDGENSILGTPGTLHTYDAASDPAVAWDSQGRGFFSCIAFDVSDFASMVWVTNSPKGAEGSFFFNLPTTGTTFIPVEDNSPAIAHDKEFIVADMFPSSPNHDNVYVTWTVFMFDPDTGAFLSSPIFGSMSTDHARTWSKPAEISGTSSSFCFLGDAFDPSRDPHACDFNQGADPVVLPNGDLVVVFNNGNTPPGNPNAQQLAVHCKPTGSSTDGTASLNCGSPSLIGNDILQNEPQCDFGRGPEECVPGPWIRTNDFPRVITHVNDPSTIYVVWQDYRSGEYDIQMARSTDGGASWGATKTVNPDTGLDHYFPAIDQSPDDKGRLGVAYFRSERVPNENSTPDGGFTPADEGGQPGVEQASSDYVLAGGLDLAAPFDFRVISPVFPPPDGVQAGFNGDYSGITIPRGNECHPIWSDTRNADPFAPANGVANDEDVFTDRITCPSGKARPGVGRIGTR